MLRRSSTIHQPNFFGADLLMQLDVNDPLLKFAGVIPWQEFDGAFSIHYTNSTGAPSKPIRLMAGLLILKQLENLSDESVVLQWKRWARKKSLMSLKDKIRAKTKHNDGNSIDYVIASLNPTLRGWYKYFQHAHRFTFSTIDGFVRRRLTHLY